MNVLIVHGPNLNLLGEAKGDPLGYEELNARLEAFAGELGLSVKIFQSNHEGVLVDTLHAERGWADAVLVNPGALTHTSYALRECLRIMGKPTIEVHLEDIRRRETWRRKSVIKDVCEAQVMGKGLASYLDALERLATGKYAGVKRGSKVAAAIASKGAKPKTIGRPEAPSASKPAPLAPAMLKTIGRTEPAAAVAAPRGVKTIGPDPARILREAAQPPTSASVVKTIGRLPAPIAEPGRPALAKVGINRSMVREKIAARLGRKITPAALATWAREQWLNVERGAATEMGQRELLEEALQALALSATPAGHLDDNALVDLMARLD